MNTLLLFIALVAIAFVCWVCAYRFVRDNRVISKVIIKNNTTYTDGFILQAVYRFLLNPCDKRVLNLKIEIKETTLRPDSNIREFTVIER